MTASGLSLDNQIGKMPRASITRGEVWLVNLEPAFGAEMGKRRRPMVVLNTITPKLPLRIAVPCTSWQDHFQDTPWLVKIEANAGNGLQTTSAVDTFQIRSLDRSRFIRKIGRLSEEAMLEVAATLKGVVG